MKFPARELRWAIGHGLLLIPILTYGETNGPPAFGNPLPDAGLSILRVLGALLLVVALFLIGVWVVKRGQQLWLPAGRAHRLKVLEVRSLGARQALYVVGYEQQRFLVASSPTGINLLTALPAAPDTPAEMAPPLPSFADSLRQIWNRKS
jgi:flagellar biogenesis protein FliO